MNCLAIGQEMEKGAPDWDLPDALGEEDETTASRKRRSMHHMTRSQSTGKERVVGAGQQEVRRLYEVSIGIPDPWMQTPLGV